MKRLNCAILALLMILGLSACGTSSQAGNNSGGQTLDQGRGVTLRILSGSENRELEEILDAFAQKENINIEMDYQGSLDIMRTLQGESVDYDAVWPASSLWLTAGDTQYRVKHAESISITPVIFGIRQSLAEELGFVGREVSVSDLLEAIQSGKPVQLRVQRLYRVSLRPAGESGRYYRRGFAGSGAGGEDHRTALWGGPLLGQFRLAQGSVPHGWL